MDTEAAARSCTAAPVSTHTAFCDFLQQLDRDRVLFSVNDKSTVTQTQGSEILAAAPRLSEDSFPTSTPEQKAVHQQPARALEANRVDKESSPPHNALQPFYLQVAKETVTAFAGQRLYQKLLRGSGNENAIHLHRVETTSKGTSTSERQLVLRQAVQEFIQVVSHEESDLQKLSTACRSHKPFSSPELSAKARMFSSLAQVALRDWAGTHRYNSWFVRCSWPSTGHDGKTLKGKLKQPGRKEESETLASTAPSAAAPKPLVLPEDVDSELQKYWRLHDEAAARSRLEALRSHDAEAFAEHVSLLKISALLEIMEKTEGFMQRIGMRLESQAASTLSQCPQQQRQKVGTARMSDSSVAVAGGRRGDADYARFRAYVASTKNEFKLMHRVDAFVAAQPTGLKATLLPHQLDGLRFLVSLHANHINGILADEMGVGKTIQTLAFLLHLKEQRKSSLDGVASQNNSEASRKPHLVLAPLSVVREWREACEQFVSESFRVGLLQELSDPARDASGYDLILMPVHAVRHMSVEAAHVQWDYIVVDEAHKAVANLKTFTAQAILALPCERRLVLTGTPLSSDLKELWSLLHFLNPSVFTDNDAFEEVFRRPFQVYEAKEVELTEEERGLLVLRLHQVLRPFLLRRTKADIDTSLRMTFHRVECPLTNLQQRVLTMLRQQKRSPAVLGQRYGDDDDDSDGTTSSSDVDAADPPTVAGAVESKTSPASVSAPHPASVPSTATLAQLVAYYLPGLAPSAASETLRLNVLADRSLGLSSANVSESIAQQLCNHAFLLPFFSQALQRQGLDEVALESAADTAGGTINEGAAAMTLACSGKFLLLHLLLSRLVVAGRKVVLFTHWLSCVDLILDYLHSRSWHEHAEVLTGGSSEGERKASVRRFRDDPTCLFFVLSIKAGGCGINLQAAHMVVLLDRDYTATNEDQALARVYRIGQRHTVRALYFATDDASEHRVTQRAEEKNRQRRAIIDDGVYQVTENATQETLDIRCGKSPVCSTESDVAEYFIPTEGLWQTLSSSSCAADTISALPTTHADEDIGHTTASSASREFWSALRQLVCSLDDLVLTDEDKACETKQEGCGVTATANENQTAAWRLRNALPPISLMALAHDLHQTCALHLHTAAQYCQSPSSSAELRGMSPAAASACGAEADAAGAASLSDSMIAQPLEQREDNTSTKSLLASNLSLSSQRMVALRDPLSCPALFWLELAYLLQMAHDGPSLARAAVDTAEENDQRRDDPAEQLVRRQLRDRRAAKRMRLATVEVPDAFREKCWELGVEEEADVARQYLKHLDARAVRKKNKRRRTDNA